MSISIKSFTISYISENDKGISLDDLFPFLLPCELKFSESLIWSRDLRVLLETTSEWYKVSFWSLCTNYIYRSIINSEFEKIIEILKTELWNLNDENDC